MEGEGVEGGGHTESGRVLHTPGSQDGELKGERQREGENVMGTYPSCNQASYVRGGGPCPGAAPKPKGC